MPTTLLLAHPDLKTQRHLCKKERDVDMFLVQCSFIAASKKFKMLTSISYNILTLDDQSGSQIFNPAL